MNQRFLLWGFAGSAFAITLAITSWQNGLWAAQDTSPAHQRSLAAATGDAAPQSTAIPARPFTPAGVTSASTAPTSPAGQVAATDTPSTVAQAAPPPPPLPSSDDPAWQTSEAANPQPDRKKPNFVDPDEQEFRAHADRAAYRGSRSH